MFAEQAVSELPPSPRPPLLPDLAPLLRKRGLLTRLEQVDSLALDQWAVVPAPTREPAGRVRHLELWSLAGELFVPETDPVPDLVLATLKRAGEPERIVRIAAPSIGGASGRRPFDLDLSQAELQTDDQIRLYAFTGRGLRAAPFGANFTAHERYLVDAGEGR